MNVKSLAERKKEIQLLMDYAVPKEERQRADALLEQLAHDPVGLTLLHSFYSYLPEGIDDLVSEVRLIRRKQGRFLLLAVTKVDRYIYLVTSEEAVFLGRFAEGIWEKEVLDFFGYPSREKFLEQHREYKKIPTYVPASLDAMLCPACHAAEGEYHELGCPVEVCPWCGGQLKNCPCRFEQLGVAQLSSERQLEALRELLHRKGRIPFTAEQSPRFPDTPADLQQET